MPTGGKAAAAVSPKADTRRTSDQGKGLTVDQAAPDSVGARDAGAGPDDTPFGVATHVYGNLEDEEMGLPADNSNRSTFKLIDFAVDSHVLCFHDLHADSIEG